MSTNRLGRVSAYGLFLVASASTGSMALAQSTPPTVNAPPVRSPVDSNGVNLATGGVEMTTTDLSIGSPGGGGLAHTRTWTGNGWRHGFFVTITTTATTAVVSVGAQSDSFTLSGGAYTSDQGSGATLTSSAGTFTYTTSDGTSITLDKSYSGTVYYGGVAGLGTAITLPSGEKITLTYKVQTIQLGPGGFVTFARLQSVNSSSGYQLKYSYGGDLFTITQVTGINNGIDYCDPAADSCTSLTQSWPSVSYSKTTSGSNTLESVTDALGHVTRYTTDSSGRMTAVKRPSNSSDTATIGYDGNGRVSTFSNINASWGYGWSLSGTTLTATVTDPLSHQRITTADTSKVVLLTDKDGLNRTTTYQYDANGRLTYKVLPEGTITSGTPTAGYIKYDYDARGNLTTTTYVSKTPGTPPNITASANFPTTCGSTLTCNKPTSITDERGNVTDYAYDPTTGFVTSITAPAPTSGAVRPQTRYAYTPLYAYYKQAAGGPPIAAAAPIYKLTATSACATGSSCAGTADEVKTSLAYGPQTSGTANNLLPYAISAGAGDYSLWATTTSLYDMVGNLYSVDGPLTGSDDTTRYRFNAIRQLVGLVGPDPDGAGSLKYRAARYTYNADGFPTLTERGTVASQSDPDWGTFSTLWREERNYDFLNRLQFVSVPASSLSQSRISSFSYDNANRLTCRADWMKFFGTLDPIPVDACNVNATGPYGADRVARVGYDAADQFTTVVTAYGTGQQRTDQTLTYTSDGKLQTIADAKSNLTTYEYDGFDRLAKVRYPLPSTPNASSTTDYEQFTYDGGDNVTQDRRRDGSLIGFGYDALSRLTLKDLPGSEPDVSYGYNNLGRMTSTSSATASLSYVYDQLGRATRQTSPQGNTDYQYDLANRRTRMTWPDGFYVTYDYLLTGETTAIRENGAASGVGVLATFGYNDLGLRTSLTRGNGAVTSYGYDTGLRLTSLNQDLAGTSADQTQGFSYNPATQIVSQTRSNDAYAFTQLYNANRTYMANGLNQYTAVGNATPGYDAKGNLTSFWSGSYGYSSENLLTSATGTSGLSYDPAMRLYQVNGAAAATRFGYDGADMIGEYSTGNALQRRYVFGPGSDEPLVWYEGTGTSDRRWLHADERGSVTAISDGSGNPIAIDSYDSYGMPSTANIGRFQYSGQMWLAETGGPPSGLYHYKARAYSPRLGRFMQTDPIGYQDSMNLYAYAGADPVNNVDPTGTVFDEIVVTATLISGSFNFIGNFGFSFQPYIPPLNFNIGAATGAPPSQPSTGDDHHVIVTGTRRASIRFQPLTLSVLSLQQLPGLTLASANPNTTATPQRVTLDRSCAGIPAARDPNVQQQALNALSLSVAFEIEAGFIASQSEAASGFSIGALFSSGDRRSITRAIVDSNFRAASRGSSTPSLFVHAHPNNTPPSPIAPADKASAAARGTPYAAIDRAGTMTCSRGR